MLGLLAMSAADPSLDRSRFTLHVARKSGIDTFEVGGPLFRPAAAREYLGRLVRDFLDPACAELLPFAVVRSDWELRKAFVLEDHGNPDFPRLLVEAIGRESEYKYPELTELAEAGFRVAEDPLPEDPRSLRPLAAFARRAGPATPGTAFRS